jgi:membrane associated rhomboid family serine protease
MIPVRDAGRVRGVPWATLVLILSNAAIFAWELAADPASVEAVVAAWAFVPADVGAGTPGAVLLSVFFSMFVHAGWLHIASNLLYLWVFGPNVESRLGRGWFLALYAACGVAAAAAQSLATPESTWPLVGASGAVAGVLGAYAILFPRSPVVTLVPVFFFAEVARVPALFAIAVWFLLQAASAVAAFGPGASAAGGAAWAAHIGGFAAGALLALPWAINARGRARSGRRR